jgi:hypothetical protein
MMRNAHLQWAMVSGCRVNNVCLFMGHEFAARKLRTIEGRDIKNWKHKS